MVRQSDSADLHKVKVKLLLDEGECRRDERLNHVIQKVAKAHGRENGHGSLASTDYRRLNGTQVGVFAAIPQLFMAYRALTYLEQNGRSPFGF